MHTCNTCSVQFTTFDAQKAHMKTDWHRYNCKRKAESLAGISLLEFTQKLENASPAQLPKSSPQNDLVKPTRVLKVEESITISDRDCLFCTRSFKNETDNLTHMINDHDFFIPDYEYLVDLKGLITYLGLKISNYFVCLYCNGSGKSFHSVSSIRHHMISKGHCKLKYEAEEDFEEFEDFYDFDSDWEEVGSGEEDGSSDLQPDVPIISSDSSQLILPSGVRVGHRSLQLYYRQSLKATSTGSKKTFLSRQDREIIDYAHKSSKKAMQNHISYRLKMGLKGNNQKHHRSTLGFST